MLEENLEDVFYAAVGVDITNLDSEHRDDEINKILYNDGDIGKIKGTYWAFPDEDKSLTIEEVVDRVRNLKKDDHNQRNFTEADIAIARAINNCYEQVEKSEITQQNPDAMSVIVQKDNGWESASLSDVLSQHPDYFTIKNDLMRNGAKKQYQILNLIVNVEPGGGYTK